MKKCPYKFPLRSREGMINYLADHESYGGWNHPYRKWSPLSWCCKIYNFKTEGKGREPVNPDFDDAWGEYVRDDEANIWERIIDDMRGFYSEDLYTTYPGDDQGEWKFCFAGRSGGHMLLKKWEARGVSVDFLKLFSGEEEWRYWLGEISFVTLRCLYRAVACMDQDFTREKFNREFEYQLSFQRQQWEEEHARELVLAEASEGLQPCPQI